MVEFASVGRFFGASGFLDGAKLYKGIVSFHIDSDKLTKGFKEHLEVFSFRSFFLKVHYKESLRGMDVATAVVLLALDSAIASGKLGAESNRYIFHLPESSA